MKLSIVHKVQKVQDGEVEVSLAFRVLNGPDARVWARIGSEVLSMPIQLVTNDSELLQFHHMIKIQI
jgi:hypothetical protein